MSSFLTPTSYSGVDFKLLRAVEDVDSITQYDWCTYVLEKLVKAAADIGENKQTLLGCIPFLMITYFQRFDFRGKSCRHSLPLIKHWDRQTLSDRLHGELDKNRLGRLTWSLVKYPRCLQKELLSIGGVPNDSQVLAIGNVVSDAALQVTSTSDKKKFIEIELPSGVDDDEELKARAVDDVHELYLKMQRNATVFYSWYADAAMTLKRLTGGMNHSSDPVATQCTQSFFQSQRMKDYAVEMQEVAERINHSVKSAPVLQQSPGDQYQNDEVDDDGYEQHVGDDDEEEDNGDEDEGDDEDGDNVDDEEDGDDMEDDGSDNEKEVTVDVGTDREGTVAASIISDEAASEKALEVSTQQIMEAVQFYGSAEFTDSANRDEYSKNTDVDVGSTREISVIYRRRKVDRKQVVVKEPPKFDREILEDIYSKEELDEAEKKFYANAAAAKEEEQTMDMDVHVAGDIEIADNKNEDDGPTDADPPVTQLLISSAEIIEADRRAEMPARENHGIGEVRELVNVASDATGAVVHVSEVLNAEADKDDDKIGKGNAEPGLQCSSSIVVSATLDDAVQVDSKSLEFSGPDAGEPEKADNALAEVQNTEVAPPATQFLFSTAEICDAERAAEQHYEEGAGNGGGATTDERLLKGNE